MTMHKKSTEAEHFNLPQVKAPKLIPEELPQVSNSSLSEK